VTVDTGVPAVKVGHITKSVEVWTNDKERRMITLIITGEVVSPEEKK
jgi:hypothetical protein